MLYISSYRGVCLLVDLALLRMIVLCHSEMSFAVEKVQREREFIHVQKNDFKLSLSRLSQKIVIRSPWTK